MSDRKKHWERIYQDKSPLEVSWYQQKPSLSLQLIKNTGVDSNAAIIDIGGGASTLVDNLNEYGYTNISVLDISSNALTHAQRRLGSHGERIKWIVADITSFNTSVKYDVWHDRAVFHFLTEHSDRQKYVSVLQRSLKPNGHLIMAAFAIGGPTKCSGLDIVQYDSNKLQAELGDTFELVEQADEVHQTPSGGEQQFGYFRYIYRQL